MESLGLEDASKRLAEHVHPKRRNKQPAQQPRSRRGVYDKQLAQAIFGNQRTMVSKVVPIVGINGKEVSKGLAWVHEQFVQENGKMKPFREHWVRVTASDGTVHERILEHFAASGEWGSPSEHSCRG